MTLIEIVPPLFEGRTGGVDVSPKERLAGAKIFNRKGGKRIRQKLRSGNYVPVEAKLADKKIQGLKFKNKSLTGLVKLKK